MARCSTWTTRSDDELDLGLIVGMDGAGCRGIRFGKFENQSEGGGRVARSDALGSSWYGVRREIGRGMPTLGIRFTESDRMIQPIKWKISSLN